MGRLPAGGRCGLVFVIAIVYSFRYIGDTLSAGWLSGNTGLMTGTERRFLSVPRLAGIGGLVHGFGRAGWSDADFLAFAASRGFKPVIMRQIHSDTVHRLDAAPAGKLEGDGLMTNVPGLMLVVRTADWL